MLTSTGSDSRSLTLPSGAEGLETTRSTWCKSNALTVASLGLPSRSCAPHLGAKAQAVELVRKYTKIYTDAKDRASAQKVLDTLPQSKRQALLHAYFSCFDRRGVFPPLSRITDAIVEHASQTLSEAAQRVGVDVAFSGVDRASSIGRRIAVPGSDLDHWSIVIRGTEAQAKQLRAEIHSRMNPVIADVLSSTHKPPIVTTVESMKNVLKMRGGEDSFYLYTLPLSEWDRNVQEWRACGPEIPKPFLASTDKELESLRIYLGDDTRREAWVAASCALEILREGISIENRFFSDELRILSESDLYLTSNILKQRRNESSLQSKHLARGKLEDFNSLELDEQFLLVRILWERHLWSEHTHEHLLSFSKDNPHLPTVLALIEKGYLVYADPKIAPSCPVDVPRDYHSLRPYLLPGTLARAPWLDHYPFERALPMDY